MNVPRATFPFVIIDEKANELSITIEEGKILIYIVGESDRNGRYTGGDISFNKSDAIALRDELTELIIKL